MDPEISNDAEAAAFLESAVSGGPEPSAGPDPQVSQTPSPQDPPAQAPATPAADPTPDSLADVDLSDLSPEARALAEERIRQYQADYTRKTQALAEQRRQFEALGDLEQAQQAVELFRALQTDPDYAVQFYGNLDRALREAGLLEDGQTMAPPTEDPDPYGLGEVDEPIARDVTELRQRIAELDEFRQNLIAEREEIAEAQRLAAQEAKIRAAHPEYTEEDIDAVYQRAWAYGGDLERAHAQYEADQQRLLMRYMERKESVDAPAPLPSSGPADAVPELETVDQAHQLALAELNSILRAQF